MKVLPFVSNNFYQRNSVLKTNFEGATKIKMPEPKDYNDLKVFVHHIYEFKKGLRSLILTTEDKGNEAYIKYRLEKEEIPYVINDLTSDRINVYFGNEDCINIVKTFDKHLNKLSPEQDFMLGIMLGYDKILQCKRYIKNITKNIPSVTG